MPPQPAPIESEEGPICFSFLNKGVCAYGDACRYRHLEPGEEKRAEQAALCFPFLNKGVCSYGDACRYRHVSADHPDAIADRMRTGHTYMIPQGVSVRGGGGGVAAAAPAAVPTAGSRAGVKEALVRGKAQRSGGTERLSRRRASFLAPPTVTAAQLQQLQALADQAGM